ncbi:MAG: GNAT family N-acetyltransferase [Burkholderiales bacterium]|nr:GNAT family N-acetyltransferase [Burkholderiales bacterium]
MNCTYRPATSNDIEGMHRVRKAVLENRLTSNKIREEHYLPYLEEQGRSWVALNDAGEVLGFAAGNRKTGNIWALFVHPDAEGRGIGKQLHDMMIAWLFSTGLSELNLSTGIHTRAEKFYEHAGWSLVKIEDSEAFFVLRHLD